MLGRKRLIIAIVMLVTITVTGCIGDPSNGGRTNGPRRRSGNISGIVIDQDGTPLADVLVSIPNTVVRMETTADGMYMFKDIPNGTYPLMATKPGYRMEGFPVASAQSAVGATSEADPFVSLLQQAHTVHIPVTVEGRNVHVEIRLISYSGSGDDVTVLNMSPPAHTALMVGDERMIELDVYYTLESVPEGRVVAILTHGDLVVGTAVEPVAEGKGTVQLSLPFTVPNAESLLLRVGLADAFGLLADVTQSLFHIQGLVEVQPVRLLLDEVTPSGIALRWMPDMQDFAALHIYRVRSPRTDLPLSDNGPLIATITDPTVTTFIDEDIMMGEHFVYTAELHTVDGRRIAGNAHRLFVRTMPEPIVVEVGWYPPVTGLLYEAVGDVLYAIRQEGRVTALSPTTRSVVGDLALGCSNTSQHTLATDGSRMFFLCNSTHRVGMVDLPSGQVTFVDDLGPVQYLAYDSGADVLYVAVGGQEDQPNTFAIVPATGQWESVPLRAAGGLVAVPGSRLSVVKPDTQQGPVVLYDLDTWEQVAEIDAGITSIDNIRFQYDGRFLYIGQSMYALPDFVWYGLAPGTGRPYTISDDGRYWAGTHSSTSTLSEWSGHAWSPIARFGDCTAFTGIQFGPGELYMASGGHVCFIDVRAVMD